MFLEHVAHNVEPVSAPFMLFESRFSLELCPWILADLGLEVTKIDLEITEMESPEFDELEGQVLGEHQLHDDNGKDISGLTFLVE